MCGKKSNRTFLQKLLPCKSKVYDGPPPPPPPPPYPAYNTGYGDCKGHSPPPYTLTNMQSTPYGASASHIAAPPPPDMKPGIINFWGISGYTGSIDTSGNFDPTQTACHLAKMEQAMTGRNQFNPFKFSQTSTATTDTTDTSENSDKDDDIPKPPDPTEPDIKKQQEYSGYCPAWPGYGRFNFGLAPPPCPPDPLKDEKKEENKCKHCKGVSGHPVKKIKKMNFELLCWACVWRAYANKAEEVWRESESVESDDTE